MRLVLGFPSYLQRSECREQVGRHQELQASLSTTPGCYLEKVLELLGIDSSAAGGLGFYRNDQPSGGGKGESNPEKIALGDRESGG